MRQVIVQRGRIVAAELPAPTVEPGRLLVEVAYSVISPGTEISKVQTSGKPLIQQALEKPEKIKQVVRLIKLRGVRKTFAKISEQVRLSSPVGYSCAGRVLQVGAGTQGFGPGDLVACAGAGLANHAEIVSVPENLVVHVPHACSLRAAASVTLGAISLQGVRRAAPQLGEVVAVIGLGMLGQITVQLLQLSGCQVVAFDVDDRRVEMARSLGIQHAFALRAVDAVHQLQQHTDGYGADATIITAASKSDSIVRQAMHMTRKKGRVVVVGDVGLALERSPFYEKELDLLISCSYGPGRYDPVYEQQGCDYPYPYVRWTENRNMSEYLRLIAARQLQIEPILEREYDITDAQQAYEELRTGADKPLGVLLRYACASDEAPRRESTTLLVGAGPARRPAPGVIRLAVVGAGQFATGTHLPNVQRLADRLTLQAVVCRTGNHAQAVAEQFGAQYASTRYADVIEDPDVDAVLICTRHQLHAEQVVMALRAGKHVFCEKPVALREEELDDILGCYGRSWSTLPYGVETPAGPVLMVGFNRRFAPVLRQMHAALSSRNTPIMVLYRVNAGYLPPDHWTQGPEGGGRIVGEACHMLDVFDYLVGCEPVAAHVEYLGAPSPHQQQGDNASITVRYADGSLGTLVYSALGHADLPKEYLEVYAEGKVFVVDDFRSLTAHGAAIAVPGGKPDKGHLAALTAFTDSIRDARPWPIPLGSLIATSRLAIQLAGGARGSADLLLADDSDVDVPAGGYE